MAHLPYLNMFTTEYDITVSNTAKTAGTQLFY